MDPLRIALGLVVCVGLACGARVHAQVLHEWDFSDPGLALGSH